MTTRNHAHDLHGLSKLAVDATTRVTGVPRNALDAKEPVKRYVKEGPCEMIHLDIKRLARIVRRQTPLEAVAPFTGNNLVSLHS